jgi:hypothetical protein
MADLKLYEIPAAFEELETRALTLETPEEVEQFESDLIALDFTLKEKVEAIAALIQRNKGYVEVIQKEQERLRKLANARTFLVEKLQKYLMEHLLTLDQPQVETATFIVRVQANSRPRIVWTRSTDEVPLKYLREKVTQSVDIDAALEDWKRGELPEGFEVELGHHIRIR